MGEVLSSESKIHSSENCWGLLCKILTNVFGEYKQKQLLKVETIIRIPIQIPKLLLKLETIKLLLKLETIKT